MYMYDVNFKKITYKKHPHPQSNVYINDEARHSNDILHLTQTNNIR